jgi:hypothetical protein
VKKLNSFLFLWIFLGGLILGGLTSCADKIEHTKAGMETLNQQLKDKFGPDTWYTSIVLSNSGGSDDMVTVDQTKDPNSLTQEQWDLFHGFWEKRANITLQIEGAKPESFMFQLDKEVSLGRLGELMELSQKKLAEEREIKDSKVIIAQVKASNQMNSKEEGIYYSLSLHSEQGGKNYHFVYDLNGNLQSLNE